MSTVAANCFVWMYPAIQPDYSQDPPPYVMQILVTGFAVDADGSGLDIPEGSYDAYYRVQDYLICASDETTASLQAKAVNLVRSLYGQEDMPCTFVLDTDPNG